MSTEPFTACDGDSWWQRNRAALLDDWNPEDDLPIYLLDTYGVTPATVVVEVGCAAGHRLDAIEKGGSERCIGVDISEAAIAEGRKLYPKLELRLGDANHIPVADGLCDVVICYFVLHWIDRDYLRLVMQEMARVLKVGGVLCVGDFAPDVDTAVPYHHRPGVWTYKRYDAYCSDFTTQGFRKLAWLIFNHDTHELAADVPSGERAAVWLARKVR